MPEIDFPALQQSADGASRKAQSLYLNLFRFSLGLMLCGAITSTVASACPDVRHGASALGAILLAAGLGLTLTINFYAPEKTWFAGRAIAESVKTISWRYMAGADPFSLIDETKIVDGRFLAELQAILKERKKLAWDLGGEIAELPQITPMMREIRGSNLEIRKKTYADERIQDQRKWYADNAHKNGRAYRTWFFGVVGAQLAALAWAIGIATNELTLNLTGIFSAIAAAVVAWSQVKRYQELAQAYGLAAHELGIIQVKLKHVQSEQEFTSFVSDAENAISREHTMWIARRDTP